MCAFDLTNVALQSPEPESSESSESVESTSEDNVGSMITHTLLIDQIIGILQIFTYTSFAQTSESDSESDEDVSLTIFSQ